VDMESPHRLLCLSDFKPRGLIVLPYLRELNLADDVKAIASSAPLPSLVVGEAEFRFSVLCPTAPETQIDATQTPAAGESPQHSTTFAILCASRPGQGSGALALAYTDLVAPAHMGVQAKDPHLRAGMKKTSTLLNLRVPMFTNNEQLHRGDVLWWQRL